LAKLGVKHSFITDKLFLVALVAAPPFWALLWWLQPPVAAFSYALENIWRFVLVAAISPVLEEVLFRGAMQEYFAQRFVSKLSGPISLANLLTSIVFTALHGVVWSSFWSLLVFFPSLVYGYFKDKTGGLAAPIGLHTYYNAGFFLVTAN
jgi:membrane protease YdiL (CAAX protease family)